MSFDPIYYSLLEPTTPDVSSILMMLDPEDEADAMILASLTDSIDDEFAPTSASPFAMDAHDMGRSFMTAAHLPDLGGGLDTFAWH